MHKSIVPLLLAGAFLSSRAEAAEGFVVGLEAGYGHWSINTNNLTPGDPTEYAPGDGLAFSQPITSSSWFDLNAHLGWNFFGHAALEAAVQGTSWNLFNEDRGGAGFVGGRATWYPLQIFLPANRQYDAGIELGAGYSIAGGPTFGMAGAYFQVGVGGEYRLTSLVGLTLNARYFIPSWNKFYFNYNKGLSTPASGASAGWTTVTVGINFHIGTRQTI